jgi:hypothetical protein
MIDFIPGPNQEKVSDTEKEEITYMLKKCLIKTTFAHQVNKAYNNFEHFASPQYNYDIDNFLKALSDIANSTSYTIKVMGGIHSDPFGHSSSLIGQTSYYNEFTPCIVQDKYIRFKVDMTNNFNQKILGPLNTTSIFHFLVDVPKIIQLQLHYSIPSDMYPLINTNGNQMKYPDLYPTSRYKSNVIRIVPMV